MIEFIKNIDWGLVCGALALLSFCPLYSSAVTYSCFVDEYGEEKGYRIWFRFTVVCGCIFLLSVAGVFIKCL